MPFQEAIKTCLTKYADFSGRARRSEYWYFYLFLVLVNIVMNIVDRAVGSPILGALVSLALLLPVLAVGARRLHDTGRSGWWLLLILTVIGIILLIVWFCLDSGPDNQYGPNPKGQGGYGGGFGGQPGYGQQPPPPPGY